MKKAFVFNAILACLIGIAMAPLHAQDRIIAVPKAVPGAPFKFEDTEDLFGKAYRWFSEGEVEWAADSLRKLVNLSGFQLEENNYYMVVANFMDNMSPLGLFHGGSRFTDTRLYGLTTDTLYYIFISKRENAESFLSTVLTSKSSPFENSLLDFLSLFFAIPGLPAALSGPQTVWVDVRRFEIPPKFQKNADISVIVKKNLGDEEVLSTALFDNTARERWSFGIATAITTVNDVQIIIDEGRIVVEPSPFGDLAAFGVINYHFSPVDTKAPTLASSFHLLGGLRLDNSLEPIVGLGFGFPTGIPVEIHFFGGLSVAFSDKLKSGFSIGDQITSEVDPFKLDIEFRPRLGLELKFP